MLKPLPNSVVPEAPASTLPSPAAVERIPALGPIEQARPLRILDFDSECRPDAYLGGDLTTRSLTGIAAKFIGERGMWCMCIVAGGRSHFEQLVQMLEHFRSAYDAADIVTGHNIMRHDLPIISGALVYCGRPPLGPKLASDTLLHGPKSGLSFSRSQENFGDLLGIVADKYHMNNARWKRANTLDADQVALTRERVESDVRMHIELRAAMLDRGLLGPPRTWRAGGRRS